MKPLTEFFADYLAKSLFHDVYVRKRAEVKKEDGRKILERFLDSRLDINRLKAANQFIDKCIFKVNQWPELGELRKAVAEREVAREMRYERYRDHTCHTLWGFLVGCWLWEHSSTLRGYLKGRTDAADDKRTARNLQDFGGVWVLGFLCHDIGYLFESDIPAGLTPNPLLDLQAACALLNDFFQGYYVTTFIGESSTSNFTELQKLAYPNYPNNSLSTVAQALRKLPFVGATLVDVNAKELKTVRADAFDWFEDCGCKNVATVEHAYRFLYENGKYGQRFLDHGIVSGLLMAQVLVLGYGLHMVARYPNGHRGHGKYETEFLDAVEARTRYGVDLTIDMLNRRVQWVFAAARHNIDPKWWDEDNLPVLPGPKPKKLKVKEDPASYLVVLVDTIQDWDRPRMNVNTKPTDFIMDSADLQMGSKGERLRIRADGPLARKRITQLEEDLDARLAGWTEFVELV